MSTTTTEDNAFEVYIDGKQVENVKVKVEKTPKRDAEQDDTQAKRNEIKVLKEALEMLSAQRRHNERLRRAHGDVIVFENDSLDEAEVILRGYLRDAEAAAIVKSLVEGAIIKLGIGFG